MKNQLALGSVTLIIALLYMCMIPLSADIKYEYGKVENIDSSWKMIVLEKQYESPVVIITPVYTKLSPPVILRLNNCDNNSFEIRAEQQDNHYPSPLISATYFVIEEGVYSQDNPEHGVNMEAYKFESAVTSTKSNWIGEEQIYCNNYTSPVVLGTVMTSNDPVASVFWSCGLNAKVPPDANNLKIGKQSGENPIAVEAAESIGYVVIEQGYWRLNKKMIMASIGSKIQNSFGRPDNTIGYQLEVDSPFYTVSASQSGMQGYDGSWAVLYSENATFTKGFIPVAYDENQIFDSERSHKAENCAILAVNNGVKRPKVTPSPLVISNDTVEFTVDKEYEEDSIYYTTNGSTPTRSEGALVDNTFKVDESANIKARTFWENKSSGATKVEFIKDESAPSELVGGIVARYYKHSKPGVNFQYPYMELPDFSQLPYYALSKENLISYNHKGSEEFASSGRNSRTGCRFDGYIYIPESNEYKFHISTKMTGIARLSIDNSMVCKVKLDKTTGSKILMLEKGCHPIRLDFYDWKKGMKLNLEWEASTMSRRYLDQNNLFYSLAELENWRKGLDSDGDGLTDMDENEVYFTNSSKADSDGDGVNDYDEIVEYGTDAWNSDTDGDGFDDYSEINSFSSDATADQYGEPLLMESIDISDSDSSVGQWSMTKDGLTSDYNTGSLTYKINLMEGDAYCLKISGNNIWGDKIQELNILVYVDDVFVSKNIIISERDVDTASYMLPYLPSGSHDLKIKWDNGTTEQKLNITNIDLYRFPSNDSNSDGIADWLEDRLEQNTALTSTFSSLTSPMCLEGIALFPNMVKVNGANAKILTRNSWYSDVKLNSSTPTIVEAEFQNGAKKIQSSIIWESTDLFDIEEQVIVRTGDSLLLNPFPVNSISQSVLVNINETQMLVQSGEKLEYCFSQAGLHNIYIEAESEYGDVVTKQVIVKAVGVNLADSEIPIVGIKGRERGLKLNGLSKDVHISADSRLVDFKKYKLGPGYDYLFTIDDNLERYVVARLGKKGPVLDVVTLGGFNVYGAGKTWYYVEDELADGTDVIRLVIAMSPVYPNVSAMIDISLSGVVLETGATQCEYLAPEFNELGEKMIRMLRSPECVKSAACHSLHVLQDGVIFGSAY
ncbi:MAG: chitobiase/beta-hexosaminidase C-terminal domain-containing protein [Planctomycetes bacterium]|nr:chitobiase/beta-hexosaminidase C-terminal domain-containing protein [Planctomycetota bacterium]